MFRVVFVALVGLVLAACSMGAQPLSLSLNDGPSTKIDPDFVSGPSRLGDNESSVSAGPPSSSEKRLAMLADQAPRKEVHKAPKGALSDRNYQRTRLDVAKARAMINEYRRKNGLKPLTVNAKLSAAAKAHSLDLAKWDRISHYGSDGSNPWDRVRRAGYEATLTAENVGTGQASLKEVFAGWKKSPSHNKNLLLKDAREMGIALVYDAKTEFKTFWTLVLGTSG